MDSGPAVQLSASSGKHTWKQVRIGIEPLKKDSRMFVAANRVRGANSAAYETRAVHEFH